MMLTSKSLLDIINGVRLLNISDADTATKRRKIMLTQRIFLEEPRPSTCKFGETCIKVGTVIDIFGVVHEAKREKDKVFRGYDNDILDPFDVNKEELTGDYDIIMENRYDATTDYGNHLELDVILDDGELALFMSPRRSSEYTDDAYYWHPHDVDVKELLGYPTDTDGLTLDSDGLDNTRTISGT